MRKHILVGVLLAGLPAAGKAITDDEVNTGIQFNFSNPGARSLALGGAFAALADDATAAYANPAGLTTLRKRELGLEVRHVGFDTPFVSGGRVSANPYDASGVSEGVASDSLAQLSYVSWVQPLDSATLALYYHRVGEFESQFASDVIDFVDSSGTQTGAVLAKTSRLDYRVANLGIALGYEINEDFSIGGSLAYSDFDIESRTDRFAGSGLINRQRQSGSDHDFVFGLGVLWRMTPTLSAGLAWRRGGDFEFAASSQAFVPPNTLSFEPEFQVPHIFSAGLAYRPTDRWLFALDVNQVSYSRISDDIQSVFGDPQPPLSIDDGTEIRLGVEYAQLDWATPTFFRAGIWRDPDHRLAYDGPNNTNCVGEGFENCLTAVLYPGGDDEMHYSLGIGWSFSSFQVDLAADFSELVDTVSLSGVYRF